MADIKEFNRGYVIAVANIINLHGEDVVAADVMAELGITWPEVVQMELSEYDMAALRKLRKNKPTKAFFDGRRRRQTYERVSDA